MTKLYNNFGVAQGAQIKRHQFDDSYIGFGPRYENKIFIEVEPRKHLSDRKSELKLGIGLNIGF